jgi:DNA polymerase III subunit gamma/tau
MYQVIARKWRPQKFDDVVGQQAVTRTLRNALGSKRLAQAFVFAGPRGVGKTTTARILARALCCVNGPTADPCGTCDACVEIAEGRDMDVMEIDAATHTGVDNVREVIIASLGIMPVRNRYKVFIIDEVHQLSSGSFNALLKSIEEPPPHVIFMMATTELDKIPETVLSRSQVYEFRTISSKSIAAQLRMIVDAEKIDAGDDALQLIARDADGSMRDAQSKLDQVIAFTGTKVAVEDVSAVLGLVGRDLLLDAMTAVADENAAAAFDLAGRAVELGYDLRAVCRELARMTRDLLVLSVDPSRISDPEIAGESERDRLLGLTKRFSREDLLRAFDVLTRAEFEIRSASQPRYHLEMALLRWIHLRKLVSIEDLIAGHAPAPARGVPERPAPRTPPPVTGTTSAPVRGATLSTVAQGASADKSGSPSSPTPPASAQSAAAGKPAAGDASFKDAFLAEIRKSKVAFYSMVVAQARTIDIRGDRIEFTFSSSQRALKEQVEQNKAWLESMALQAGGRKVTVAATQDGSTSPQPSASSAQPAGSNQSSAASSPPAAAAADADRKAALKAQALADSGVQAMLEVFPAEIRDVEEM